MKKHSFYLAFLAFFAILAFFASCGEGDPVDLEIPGSEKDAYENSKLNIIRAIEECEKNHKTEWCLEHIGDFISSSSGGYGNLSSGTGSSSSHTAGAGVLTCVMPKEQIYINDALVPVVKCDGAQLMEGVSFSPTTDITVNNSGQITFNAERNYTIDATANCEGTKSVRCSPEVSVVGYPDSVYEVPNFTCSWNPNSGVIAGDPSSVSFAVVNSANQTKFNNECTVKKVFMVIDPGVSSSDTVFFDDISIPIQTSGKLLGKHDPETWSWTWPKVDTTVYFTGIVWCSNGQQDGYKDLQCNSLGLRAPPPPETDPTNRIATFTGQDYSSSSTLYYYIGSQPKFSHNITQITKNTESKCDKYRFEIKGGNYSSVSEEYTLSTATDIVDITVPLFTGTTLTPVAVNVELTGRLIATCRGSFDTLATAKAILVPDPTLTGTCSWNVVGNRTKPSVGATPQGVKLANGYGRCGHSASSVTPYTLPTSAYSYNSNPWPPASLTEGITYSGVAAKVECGQYGGSITSTPACPGLLATNVLCGLKSDSTYVDLSVLCPNTNWNAVKWNQRPTVSNNTVAAGCYWVANWTGASNVQYNIQNGGTWRINGTSFSAQSNITTAANAKVDGGIYIYTTGCNGGCNVYNGTYMVKGSSPPSCQAGSSGGSSSSQGGGSSSSQGGAVTISCNTDNITKCYAQNAAIPRPNTSCSDGSTPGTASFYLSGANGGGTPGVVAGWNSVGGTNGMNTTGVGRVITLRSLSCGGTTITVPSPYVTCGSVTITGNGVTCPN